MAEKNGIYKVKTASGYDEINLKTIASQVKTTDNKSVQDFFDNGGTIGGAVTVSGNVSAVGGTVTATNDIISKSGNISGKDITASGNANITGNATIKGDVTTNDVIASGNATVTGNVSANGISATGDITTKNSLRADVNIVADNGIVQGKTLRVKEDATIDGDVDVKGYYQPNSGKIMKLFEKDMAIDGNSNAIRLSYDKSNYFYLGYDGEARFYSKKLKNVEHKPTIYTDDEGHTRISNGQTMIKMLNLTAPEVQMCNVNNDGSCGVKASYYNTNSSQKYKTNIKEYGNNAIDILKANNVKEYNLKSEVELVNKGAITQEQVSDKLGFILEELTDEAKRLFSPKGSDGVDTYCIVSMLWKVCQEQQARIEQLEAKILNA